MVVWRRALGDYKVWIALLSLFLLALLVHLSCVSHAASYGATPFANIKNAEIQKKVREGLRLEQIAGSADEYFQLAASCWAQVGWWWSCCCCCSDRAIEASGSSRLLRALCSLLLLNSLLSYRTETRDNEEDG